MDVENDCPSLKITIENCRNIERASIAIDPGKLNVKFAPNGTGKSSIAKALNAAGNGSDGSSLAPFKWLQDGSSEEHPFCVSGLDDVSSVDVFDDDYVQSVVFQQDSLFPGSFDAFVKTPEFIETERELKYQLRTLIDLVNREDIRKLSVDLNAFWTGLIGGGGLDMQCRPKGTSPVVKALRDGNTWDHEDPLLAPFKPIVVSGPFKKWASWHKQGGEYFALTDGSCPYCGQAVATVKERIDAVGGVFDSVKAGNVEKVIEAVSIGSAYMNEATVKQLNMFIDSAEPITDQAKGFIGKVAQDARLVLDSLEKLSTVSSYFDLSRAEDLDRRLANCKINIELVDSFDSVKCRGIAEEINKSVGDAMSKVGKLRGLVNHQKDLLARALKGRCEEINAFLESAGYPYTVDIPGAEDGKCSVRLVHSSSWEVANSREALSYGERNAFALVFFAYECMRKQPDLVILDDPISSFDGAKRYALLNMLFLGGAGEATLKRRTVLLLTHDYGTLFDIEHTHKPAFQPSAKSCVLSCVDGMVSEVVVSADDMVLASALYESLAKGSASIIVRLVYARKVLELREDKSDAYDLVSSLFHHRPVPALKDGTPMGKNEIGNGIAGLEDIVGEPVDYAAVLQLIENPVDMLALFEATHSNYEKLQLARIAMDAKTDDNVLKERMDDSVHIGNGFLYQLDPTRFELVPSQLVQRCRKAMRMMSEGGEGLCSNT